MNVKKLKYHIVENFKNSHFVIGFFSILGIWFNQWHSRCSLTSLAYCGIILTTIPFGSALADEYFIPAKGFLINNIQSMSKRQNIFTTKLDRPNQEGDKLFDPINILEHNSMIEDVSKSEEITGTLNQEFQTPIVSPLLSEPKVLSNSSNHLSDELAQNDESSGKPKGSIFRLESDTPFPKDKSNNLSTTSKSKSKEMVVVAEGVGKTPAKALKDAFRNSIRQVVGAVFDAETIIKNDEIISDKILSYSDGFVKRYEILSESEDDGLFRKRIKATVERRSVIAKLKASNVTVKSVDGEGLFSSAVTKSEAKANATALLKKSLLDLPTLLTANVVKKPEYEEGRSELIVELEIAVDKQAYAAYSKRLDLLLKKICLGHTSLSLNAKSFQANNRQPMIEGLFESKEVSAFAGPKIADKPLTSCIWLCVFNNETNTFTRWNGYIVDVDLVKAASHLQPALQQGSGKRYGPSAKILVTTSALDSEGNLIAEDQYEITNGIKYGTTSSSDFEDFPFLRQLAIRKRGGVVDRSYNNFFQSGVGAWRTIEELYGSARRIQTHEYYAQIAANLYIAPYSFSVEQAGRSLNLYYRLNEKSTRRLKLSLKELKRIKKIRCEVSFHP